MNPRPPLFSREGLCALLVFCAVAVIPGGLVALLTAWLWGIIAGLFFGSVAAIIVVLMLCCVYTGSR